MGFNLWTYDGSDLVINDLPGGAKIIIEEGGGGRRKWYVASISFRVGPHSYTEYFGKKGTYQHAKEQAEKYVEDHFNLWLLAEQTKLRPPQLGTDILHPDDE